MFLQNTGFKMATSCDVMDVMDMASSQVDIMLYRIHHKAIFLLPPVADVVAALLLGAFLHRISPLSPLPRCWSVWHPEV